MEMTERYEDESKRMAEHISGSFASKIGREQAGRYLNGLLSRIERKNGWQMAEARGDKTPYQIQQFLYRSAWDEDGTRDGLQEYVKERLGDPEAVLVADETGFLKKGIKSAGVKRQYSGTAGRIENCQVGVFLTYAGANGFTLIDRELYMPKEWIEDKERCKSVLIPDETEFRTKPEMALDMIKRANNRGLPYKWVTADSVYGDYTDIRQWLESQGKSYVLAVSGKAYFWQGMSQFRVSAILGALEGDWLRLSCGEGTKSNRVYDWKAVFVNQPQNEAYERCLLIRKSIRSGEELRAFICCYPKGTPLQKLVEVAGIRWTVERCFQETKSEVGLDQYEVRSFPGWYRHITLAMCAHALLTAVKLAFNAEENAELGLRPEPSNDSMAGFKKGRKLL